VQKKLTRIFKFYAFDSIGTDDREIKG